jgi:hypothetical protein
MINDRSAAARGVGILCTYLSCAHVRGALQIYLSDAERERPRDK